MITLVHEASKLLGHVEQSSFQVLQRLVLGGSDQDPLTFFLPGTNLVVFSPDVPFPGEFTLENLQL
jgi:hypothetical protein